jgi:hypothetical protein
MKVELKTWTSLGLATALVGAGLSGCAGEGEGGEGEGGEAAQTTQAGEMGEGEGGEGEGGEGEAGAGGEAGEGGESGEGGVAIASAATDPIVYGSALAVAEAHAIAARDAFAAGKTDPAAEMFAHPVAEVLAEMDPVFEQRGVEDFKSLFFDASAAVLDGEDQAQIDARFEGIIAALRAAGEKAPASETSAASVAAGIATDQIKRAIAMYPEAISSGRYEPYLDGYGYTKAAEVAFSNSTGAILEENDALHAAISEALALLATAYPSVEQPASLDIAQGALLAAESKIELSQ